MSASRSAFSLSLWLMFLAAGVLACSEGVTEPASSKTSELTEMDPKGTVEGIGESALAVEVTRPMKISAGISFVGEVVPPPAPCLQLLNSEIKGTATHLGRFEGVGSTCILDVIAPDPDPPFPGPGPPPFLTGTFSNPLWVLTAANGDELWLQATDAVAVCLLDNFFACRSKGTHTIIGGTGRFAGASGELDSEAVNEDGQGPDDFESHGWIRY